MNLGGNEMTQCESPRSLSGQIRNQTLTEQLEGKKQDLESRLAEVTRALEELKKNPGIENILNLIAKVRY